MWYRQVGGVAWTDGRTGGVARTGGRGQGVWPEQMGGVRR